MMNITAELTGLIQVQDSITHIVESREAKPGHKEALAELQDLRGETVERITAYVTRLERDAAHSREKLQICATASQSYDAGDISAGEFAHIVYAAIFPEVSDEP